MEDPPPENDYDELTPQQKRLLIDDPTALDRVEPDEQKRLRLAADIRDFQALAPLVCEVAYDGAPRYTCDVCGGPAFDGWMSLLRVKSDVPLIKDIANCIVMCDLRCKEKALTELHNMIRRSLQGAAEEPSEDWRRQIAPLPEYVQRARAMGIPTHHSTSKPLPHPVPHPVPHTSPTTKPTSQRKSPAPAVTSSTKQTKKRISKTQTLGQWLTKRKDLLDSTPIVSSKP